MNVAEKADRQGWLLYDHACSFCRRWVPLWRRVLRKRGYEIVPLQSPWVSQALRIPAKELLKNIRLLSNDGRQIEGADVYRFFMRRIWWMLPLYAASTLPGIRRFFDWCYETIADHRYR